MAANSSRDDNVAGILKIIVFFTPLDRADSVERANSSSHFWFVIHFGSVASGNASTKKKGPRAHACGNRSVYVGVLFALEIGPLLAVMCPSRAHGKRGGDRRRDN